MRNDRDHDVMNRDRTGRRERYDSGRRPNRAFFRSDDDFDHQSRDEERYRRTQGWGGLMNRDDDDRREHRRFRGRGYGDRDPRYGPDAHRDELPRNETERLIASDKVEGTPVIGPHGERLGSIHNFMVDKRSGEVVYAVLKSNAGFLGLEQRYYPIDWRELDYDTRADGYGVDFTREELEERRSFDDKGRPWESRNERETGWRNREERDWGRDRDRW